VRSYLAIKDVGVFPGRYFGWEGSCSGETAFFRSRSFCWDIMTDPAFHKKIVITDRVDVDDISPANQESLSFMPHLSGIVFLGNIKSDGDSDRSHGLRSFLEQNRITGFIPDRQDLLFDALRFVGDSTAGLAPRVDDAIGSSLTPAAYQRVDMISVSAPQEYLWDLTPGEKPGDIYNVIVWDFGTSFRLMKTFREIGCGIRVVPADTSPEDIVALHPDAIIISGRPLSGGDVESLAPRLHRILGIRPLMGVGGGAVTLARTLGVEVAKLESSHFGSAIPVEEVSTGRISSTSQSHSLTPIAKSLEQAGCRVTHVNVCDESVEGFASDELQIIGSLYTEVFGENPPFLDSFLRLLHKTPVIL